MDTNSRYCNLLQCEHFANTALIAKKDGELLGSVTGYCLPEQPNVLFVWQVAVSKKARGYGLAKALITNLLSRQSCRKVEFIETTITPDNEASWALFKGLSVQLSCGFEQQLHYQRDKHFDGQHDDEYICRIGPFDVNQLNFIKRSA